MTLLENWRSYAYNPDATAEEYQKIWNAYFAVEKGFYQHLLKAEEPIHGTVKALADLFQTDLRTMVGILDGIDESLKKSNSLEELTEDTVVSLDYDKEKLYYNMVAAKADWLYELPEWDKLLTKERRKELYKEQKASGTVVKEKTPGRNDPCPCGSGKKYKFCCGRK